MQNPELILMILNETGKIFIKSCGDSLLFVWQKLFDLKNHLLFNIDISILSH
jgi:hypothetical protein